MAVLSESDRIARLDELEKLLKEYVETQRNRLEYERRFLLQVLETQSYSGVNRRSANRDKLNSLATAKELLTSFNFKE